MKESIELILLQYYPQELTNLIIKYSRSRQSSPYLSGRLAHKLYPRSIHPATSILAHQYYDEQNAYQEYRHRRSKKCSYAGH